MTDQPNPATGTASEDEPPDEIESPDEIAAPESPTPNATVYRWHWSVALAFVGIAIVALNWIVPRLGMVIDTLGNFQWQIVFLTLSLAVYQWIKKRRMWSLVIASLIALPAAGLAGLYIPGDQPPAGKTTIRMMTLNVHDRNRQFDRTLELIEEIDPDIVNLIEYTDAWDTAVRDRMTEYPYRVGPLAGNIIYSKLPLVEDFNRHHSFDPWFSPGIGSKMWIDDQLVYLLLVHTISPTSPERMIERESQILGVREAMFYRVQNMHVVVAGDFNATTHCDSVDQLLNYTGLRDSRQGFGIQNSWPTWFRPLGICIDHVFVGPQVHVKNRRTGRNVGSDHLPVIVELSFGPHPRKRPDDEIGKL